MIKIQSSYKIIKKDYVSLLKDDPSLIDTRLDLPAVGLGYKSNGKSQVEEDVSTDNGKNGRSQDLDREREALMEEIMAEAQVIKEKARADGHREGYDKGYKEGVKQGIDKGRLEGLEQGYMEGLKKADQEAERIRQSSIKMLQQAQDELDNYIDENRENIINLAATMAEAIVHRTIDTSSEDILQLVKPIIQGFRRAQNIIISCHPRNYDFVMSRIHELEEKHGDIKFMVLEDESLEKNGCIVENDNQIIDLQISKQLENMLAKIRDME